MDTVVMKDVYSLVRSLRDKQLSRNRHFELHATPVGAEARRLHRFLLAIERDLKRASKVHVLQRDGGCVLTLAFSSVRLRRIVALTEAEYALLLEAPEAERRLTAGGQPLERVRKAE
jgi:hypothetical protein